MPNQIVSSKEMKGSVTQNSPFVCEVRVTTYKRPNLLERALKSLQEQTYKHWRAIIFDDSPMHEGKEVLDKLDDDWIIYRPNPENLGRNKNIDFAFQSSSIVGGRYAFVLEDDNYLFPDFIEKNINSLDREGVNIVLRNQEIRLETDGQVSIPTKKTTRGKWLSTGIYHPIDLYATMFFCEGISNGGLFWDTANIQSELIVGECIDDSWYQEIFRTLKIVEPVFFDSNVGCVWTQFETLGADRGSKLPSFLSTPSVYNRATQVILIRLLNLYGETLIKKAQSIAISDIEKAEVLEHQMLNALNFRYPFKYVGFSKKVFFFLKHCIRRIYTANHFEPALIGLTQQRSGY